ncbi:MAG TPA: hypothetical protein VMO26_06685 [Vicinamibacterales bacterium]|nr:hypothetical protein [Vicinamibacterales bacterium]
MKLTLAVAAVIGLLQVQDDWLTWSAARAQGLAKAAYVTGRVGGFFDTRVLRTERSYNYKLAATWMTPEVIRATARMTQLTERLTDAEARALVQDAADAGDTVVLVEIDPREGSGVIPNDWSAFLQPLDRAGQPGPAVRGVNTPGLRQVRSLSGVLRRNYDYDRFWVVFPLVHADGTPVLPQHTVAAELIVRIHDREGSVKWPVPPSVQR